MNRAAENIRLYAATAASFIIGIGGFLLFAPIDKNAVPYQNKLENGCFMLFGSASGNPLVILPDPSGSEGQLSFQSEF